MAVIFNDTFTDSDNTILHNHTPNTGLSWTEIINIGSGNIKIDANVLDAGASDGGLSDGSAYTADVSGGYGVADYEVQLTYVSGLGSDDPIYILARVQDANNFYMVKLLSGSGQIWKRVGGTFSAIGTTFSAPASGSVMKFELIGTALKVYDDGVEVKSVTDGDITAAGKAGVGMGQIGQGSGHDMSGQIADNFSVNTLAAATLTVTTQAVSAITNNSATGNGNVTEDGGDTVTRRGFVVSTTTHSDPGDTDPDVSDYETVVDESGTFGEGAFTGSLTGLSATTQYFVRAFAETTAGFEYGDEVNFTTLENPLFALKASANIAASGEATTAQLTAPSGKTTSDFVAGRIQDDENPADAVNITADDYTELEWCIEATTYAEDAETYEFRVTQNGVVLDTYTVTPEWTIGSGAAAAPFVPRVVSF